MFIFVFLISMELCHLYDNEINFSDIRYPVVLTLTQIDF